MKVQRLVFRCSCGGETRPVSVYLTEKREVLIYGLCDDCDQRVQIQDPIINLFKMACDISKESRPVKPPLQIASQSDASFLHDMGIGGSLE